ncbi:tetratricopeptide repeat protein [Ostertagia ostertagi]
MRRERDWRRAGAAVCTAALVVLTTHSAVQARESDQQAALAASSPTPLCVDKDDTPPATRIVACTVAIDAKALKGRELAAAHLNRGQAYRAVGDQARAAADYSAAIKLFDDATNTASLNASQFLQRGIAHHALDDVERALSDYDEAIRLDTGNALAHVDRGILIATRKADMRRAIADFDRALALVPDNVDTLILRGNAYTSVGEHGRALADLDRAAELAPDNPRAFMVRGLVNARLGDMQRAFTDYNMALSIDPNAKASSMARPRHGRDPFPAAAPALRHIAPSRHPTRLAASDRSGRCEGTLPRPAGRDLRAAADVRLPQEARRRHPP